MTFKLRKHFNCLLQVKIYMEVSTSFSHILVCNYTILENKLSMFCHCYSFLAGWISFLILPPLKIHLSNWLCSQNEDQKLIKNAQLVTGINTYTWWKWTCLFCETGHQFIADIAFLKLKEIFLFIWMKYKNLPKQKSPSILNKQNPLPFLPSHLSNFTPVLVFCFNQSSSQTIFFHVYCK